MLTHYPHAELGRAQFDWLDARHHFSFGQYINHEKPNFGDLCAINDDIIQPQSGFAPHGHQDMEIITYVRRGAISHKDSQGNKGRTVAGDIQVMSAGTGIQHSEYNLEDEATNLFQIWITPDETGLPPRWDSAEFPRHQVGDALPLLVSGDGQAPLHINNKAAKIYAGALQSGQQVTHAILGQAYILVSEGSMCIGGIEAVRGDGVTVQDKSAIVLEATGDSEVLIIDVAA